MYVNLFSEREVGAGGDNDETDYTLPVEEIFDAPRHNVGTTSPPGSQHTASVKQKKSRYSFAC